MKNSKLNNLKIVSFFAGVAFIIIACLMLLKPLTPDSFKTKSVFELGILDDLIGEALIKRDKETLKAKSGSKIYSGDTIDLKADSELSVNIGDERVSISGPANFEIAFPNKEVRDVFLNFTTFTKTDLIDKKPLHIWLVYKNWHVEPGFGAEVVESNAYKALSLPAEKNIDETTESKLDETDGGSISINDQEGSLEEAIAIKRPLLKRCYENYLKKNPQATGELTVEFTVQSSGKVSSSQIAKSSFINDSLFKTCIRDVFRKVRARSFSGEPLIVTYPIVFE